MLRLGMLEHSALRQIMEGLMLIPKLPLLPVPSAQNALPLPDYQLSEDRNTCLSLLGVPNTGRVPGTDLKVTTHGVPSKC